MLQVRLLVLNTLASPKACLHVEQEMKRCWTSLSIHLLFLPMMPPKMHKGMVTRAQMTRMTTIVPKGRACVDCSMNVESQQCSLPCWVYTRHATNLQAAAVSCLINCSNAIDPLHSLLAYALFNKSEACFTIDLYMCLGHNEGEVQALSMQSGLQALCMMSTKTVA